MKSDFKVKEMLRSITVLAAFVICALFLNVKVYGADFNAVVSSGEATQGENVTVTVTMSSSATVGAYDLALTYDANILEYVSGADGGGGGSLRLYNDSNYTTSYTTTITFKAKAAGSTKISIVKQGDICDIDLNDLNLKASDGTVTVKAPAAASSNANLASLSLMAVKADGWSGSVTTMPEFSKDVTSYQLWLGGEFTKLSISAVAEDGKSTITTAGTDLTAGQDNTTTITVKAEDGTVKTYTITVHVREAVDTETTTATGEQNTAEANTEEPTEGQQENTTGSENTDINSDRNVTISEKSYTVTDVAEDLSLPEGFERTAVSWNGTEVMGASDQSGTLKLLYLQNNETGEGSFFVYDNEKSSYLPFLAYTITQRTYIMLMADEDLTFGGEKAVESSALELTTLNVADGYIDAYKIKNTEYIYIVKAMNWDNKIEYYYYSNKDGSMIPYFDIDIKEQSSESVQTSAGAQEKSDGRTTLNYVLVAVCIVLLIVGIALTLYAKKLLRELSDEDEEENDGEDDEDDTEYDDYSKYDDDDSVNNEIENEEESKYKEADNVYDNDSDVETENTVADDIPEIDIETVTTAVNDEMEKLTEENKKQSIKMEIENNTAEEPVSEQAEADASDENVHTEPTATDVSEENVNAEPTATDASDENVHTEPTATDLSEEKVHTEQAVTDVSEKKVPAEPAATDVTEKNASVEPETKEENTTEHKEKEENMSEQELDNAIDDILGQLFK